MQDYFYPPNDFESERSIMTQQPVTVQKKYTHHNSQLKHSQSMHQDFQFVSNQQLDELKHFQENMDKNLEELLNTRLNQPT